MKKVFNIKNIVPFDLLRWDRDAFYSLLDNRYKEIYGVDIEILEADLSFISGGVKVKILTYRA